MTHETALEILNLKKTFVEPAVDDLSLTVRAGEFYALLGPNGAGKTTTAFADPIAAKRLLAWVPDEPMIYDKLTPTEYLEFIAGLWSMDAAPAKARASALLEEFGLGPQAHERCGGFSKGMRQKVALAGALIHDPKLIILDEPLTGLDAGAARQVKAILRGLVEQGVTIIMTTHILEVAERMADRIGIIAKGKLIAEGTFAELSANAGAGGKTLEDIFLDIVGNGHGALTEAAERAA